MNIDRKMETKDRSIAFLIFGFLLACYLFTYTGVIQSSDGLAMFSTSESIVRRGELDMNQLLWMGNQQGNLGPDGELYSRKGLGVTLLALPLVWLATLWSAIGTVHAALLVTPLLTAWTGALLYRTGRRFSWTAGVSICVSLTFGLATLAWPYTQTFFSDPVCGWGLYGALYGLLSYSQTGRKRYLIGGGAAWGIAYLARVVNLLTLPLYLFLLLLVIFRHTSLNPLSSGRSPWDGAQWRPLISFLTPVVFAGLASLWWNAVRYGSIFESGYVESERFDAIWWFGISGLLAGPSRGLLWYSPILILGIWGISWFWRSPQLENTDQHSDSIAATYSPTTDRGKILNWSMPRLVLLHCGLLTLIYVLTYGKWYMWHGGFSWGPRFLVPILPFLSLLTGPAWQRLLWPQRGKMVGRAVGGALFMISVGVQWLGMLIPFGLVQNWLAERTQPLFAPETFIRLSDSPLLLQWRFVSAETVHLAWWKLGPTANSLDWLGLAMSLFAVIVGAMLVVRQIRQTKSNPTNFSNWLYGSALVIIALGLLTHYEAASALETNRMMMQQIESLEEPGDAILNLQSAQTQQLANVYHGSLPTFGFLDQEVLNEADGSWLTHLQSNYQRLWLIPNAAYPAGTGWEGTLRVNHFLLFNNRLVEPDGQRLGLFALADAQNLEIAGLGAIFGDLEMPTGSVTEENGWARLNGYAVSQEVSPGASLLVELHWQSLQVVDKNYHVFVHLLDATGTKHAQRDGQPVQWLMPTSIWEPGQEIVDRYGLMLAQDLPQGEYTVAIGLYDAETGDRLPVSAGPWDRTIEVGPILVR